jgi:outer membrane protein assembly factor BamB
MRRQILLSTAFAAAVTAAHLYASEQADMLTHHADNTRLGAVLNETTLTTTSVSSGRFGKLWTLYADGQIVAQPLYVSRLKIDTSGNGNATPVQGAFNTVVIATMHNTVYAYDADKEARGPEGRTVPLWATWLGQPRPGGKDIDMWSTNDPEWGIVSTPVINSEKTTLFVVAWHDDGQDGRRYKLHALNLQNGRHRLPPVVVGVSTNDPSNPCRPQSTFNPCTHKQRAGLLLADGVVYVGFGGDGSRGALHAYDAQTLALRAVWSPTPTGSDGGIWQSGQAPAADSAGNIYVMTANGTFDGNSNAQNLGNSFVKLRLEGSNLVVKDFFTPCNFQFLNGSDLDLGSGGPVLIPGTPSRIISGGKQGVLYVVNRDNMGRFSGGATGADCQNPNVVQQVSAFGAVVHQGETHYGNIHGSPVFWQGPDTARVYAWGENNHLKAYKYSAGRLQEVNAPKQSVYRPPTGMPGGMLALSANGKAAGSGILWAIVPLDGDANKMRGVKGILLALDAQDVSRTLWTSEQFSDRDRLGLFAKFNPPIVANGKVFVPTYGDDEPRREYGGDARPLQFPRNYFVAVYGLLPLAPAPTVVDQNRDDVTVLRAATEPLKLGPNQCSGVDGVSVDCTAAIAQAAGAPSFHRALFGATQNFGGCALLRVTTVSRDGALANTTGIGFWSAQQTDGNVAPENSGRFVPKAALKAVGTTVLRNGAPATLHEFVGAVNCPIGGTAVTGRLFKPYMQFEGGADGRIFRNWDLAENYRISPAITSFDRSGDVLRP